MTESVLENKCATCADCYLVDEQYECKMRIGSSRALIQDPYNDSCSMWIKSDKKLEKKREGVKEEFKIEKSIMVYNEDYIQMSEDFWNIQPYYFDVSGIWWLWNFKTSCWEIVDEIDLTNRLKKSAMDGLFITRNAVFAQIIRSMKMVGRDKRPKEAPNKWVQFKDKAFSITSKRIYNVTKDYFFTNPIPWVMGKDSNTPTMDKLFEEWVGEKYVQTLYEILAYCCYSDYPIQVLFCLYGGGRNGKSCFLKVLTKFLGHPNVCSTDLDLLVGHNKSRFEVFKLYKKLACIMGETNFGVMESSAMLKKLTGSDLVGFEVKGKLPFDDFNYAKVLIASNSLPTSEDTSEGFFRRWIIIDFPNQFKEGRDITETIPNEEYEALAKKATEIIPKLLEKGEFKNQGTIMQRKDKYILASNPLPMFIQKYCKVDPYGYVRYSEFFTTYIQFLAKSNKRVVSRKEFSGHLVSEGYENRKTSKEGQIDYYIENLRWINPSDPLKLFPDLPDFKEMLTRNTCIESTSQFPEIKEIRENPKPKIIHSHCKHCNDTPSHFYNDKGEPLCETCYGSVQAQEEVVR